LRVHVNCSSSRRTVSSSRDSSVRNSSLIGPSPSSPVLKVIPRDRDEPILRLPVALHATAGRESSVCVLPGIVLDRAGTDSRAGVEKWAVETRTSDLSRVKAIQAPSSTCEDLRKKPLNWVYHPQCFPLARPKSQRLVSRRLGRGRTRSARRLNIFTILRADGGFVPPCSDHFRAERSFLPA
jgi:hypothetical protein